MQQNEEKRLSSHLPNPSRREIWRMFDRVAPRYDLLNHLLSFGQDIRWRRKLAGCLKNVPQQEILDLATGTGDVILSLCENSEKIEYAVGIDMSERMLRLGRGKIITKNRQSNISLVRSDASRIPFADYSFDTVLIAFGIRNMVDVQDVLTEIHRVLKPDGRVLILEFSLPENRFVKKMYLFYFRKILTRLGRFISGDKNAYSYLNETVETFPYGDEFCRMLTSTGFENANARPLTFGVATIYQGDK